MIFYFCGNGFLIVTNIQGRTDDENLSQVDKTLRTKEIQSLNKDESMTQSELDQRAIIGSVI